MSVPAFKNSKSKVRRRRSHHALKPVRVQIDKETGEAFLPHMKGQATESVKPEAPKAKKEEVKKTSAKKSPTKAKKEEKKAAPAPSKNEQKETK